MPFWSSHTLTLLSLLLVGCTCSPVGAPTCIVSSDGVLVTCNPGGQRWLVEGDLTIPTNTSMNSSTPLQAIAPRAFANMTIRGNLDLDLGLGLGLGLGPGQTLAGGWVALANGSFDGLVVVGNLQFGASLRHLPDLHSAMFGDLVVGGMVEVETLPRIPLTTVRDPLLTFHRVLQFHRPACLAARRAWVPWKGALACSDCPEGYFCPTGTSRAQPCPVGSYNPRPAAHSVASCSRCPVGTFGDHVAAQSVAECAPCPTGTAGTLVVALDTLHSLELACHACPLGTYSSAAGGVTCTPCPAGSYNPTPGATTSTACGTCATFNSSMGTVPTFPSGNAMWVTTWQARAWMGAAALGTVLFMLTWLLGDKAAALDMLFSVMHMWDNGDPVRRRSTACGGRCTVFSLSMILGLAASMVIAYHWDNVVVVHGNLPHSLPHRRAPPRGWVSFNNNSWEPWNSMVAPFVLTGHHATNRSLHGQPLHSVAVRMPSALPPGDQWSEMRVTLNASMATSLVGQSRCNVAAVASTFDDSTTGTATNGWLLTNMQCWVCRAPSNTDARAAGASSVAFFFLESPGTFQTQLEPKQTMTQVLSITMSGIATLISVFQVVFGPLELFTRWLFQKTGERHPREVVFLGVKSMRGSLSIVEG